MARSSRQAFESLPRPPQDRVLSRCYRDGPCLIQRKLSGRCKDARRRACPTMIYRHRRRPRNLAQKIQTCGDDLLSQLIGLGDLSGPHHRPSPVDNTVVCWPLIAPPAVTASQLPTYFRRSARPHAEIITQTGIPITGSRIVSERELFCSDSERTKA